MDVVYLLVAAARACKANQYDKKRVSSTISLEESVFSKWRCQVHRWCTQRIVVLTMATQGMEFADRATQGEHRMTSKLVCRQKSCCHRQGHCQCRNWSHAKLQHPTEAPMCALFMRLAREVFHTFVSVWCSQLGTCLTCCCIYMSAFNHACWVHKEKCLS